MSKEFKINLLEEMDLLYAKIHRLEDVCEQANIMLNQRDEIEEGLNKRIAELEALVNVSEGLYERIYEQAARIAELENEHNVWLIGASNAVKNLEARIAELEAERRWIPVSERLPEENKCVLVYDAGGNMTVDFLVTSGEVEKYFWLAKYRILFWMPLPESPNDTQTQTIVYGKECEG